MSPVVVPVIVPELLLDAARHAGPQPLAQTRPLLVGHHHEFELDLVDTRHRGGGPVDLVRQLLGPGPCGHRQGHLDLDATATRAHGTHQAEVTQGQADLRLPDGAHRSPEL